MTYSPDKVQFDGEEQYVQTSPTTTNEAKATGLAKLFIEKGVAVDKKSANVLLIGVVFIFLLVMAAILFFGLRDESPPTKPYQSDGYYSLR